eukprot:CAMPEP_0204321786 /NCGR_PEP_ID=MMETSP0469-20131031/8350_1 /ASSEMBLY_ACC=CAM_ASM_000384 /TAXON_ID=2969 /ORGANISM="Oxyrrhis marina" /LENGTH=165 /DNA_ID=CAMNT_0051303111 /DNA_START=131 /DNA_END=628 /DNA_ORIENTATION=-
MSSTGVTKSMTTTTWVIVAVGSVMGLVLLDHHLFQAAESTSVVPEIVQLGAALVLVAVSLFSQRSTPKFAAKEIVVDEPCCCEELHESEAPSSVSTGDEEEVKRLARNACTRWNAGACKAKPGTCKFGHYCSLCNHKKARHRAGSRFCPLGQKAWVQRLSPAQLG